MRETEQDNKVRYIIITFDGIYLYVYSAYIYIKPFLHNVRKMSHSSPGIVNQTLHHVRSIRYLLRNACNNKHFYIIFKDFAKNFAKNIAVLQD